MLRAGAQLFRRRSNRLPGGRREECGKLCHSERGTAARGRRPGFPLSEPHRERHPQVKMRSNLGHESAADPGAAGKKTGRAGGK